MDPTFGNAWTNVPFSLLESIGVSYGGVARLEVRHGRELVLAVDLPVCRTFGEVAVGEPLIYPNELMNVALSRNQGSVVARYGVDFGADWQVRIGCAAS